MSYQCVPNVLPIVNNPVPQVEVVADYAPKRCYDQQLARHTN